MAATIREAGVHEVEAILPMYEWLFDPPGRTPPWWNPGRARNALTEAISAPESAVFLAEQDGELIGLISAYLDLKSVRFGPRCWVEDLAVHPDRRLRGIGTELVRRAQEWARERGATHFELDTGIARTDAQRFYERLGESHKGFSYSWEL
jgi:GNAT superfamily N-acetyltransferase